MERETGFEPATPSLEGWRSTTELFPRIGVRATTGHVRAAARLRFRSILRGRAVDVPVSPHDSTMVARGGFEPPKAYASRFTVCPLWPTWVPRHSNRGLQ